MSKHGARKERAYAAGARDALDIVCDDLLAAPEISRATVKEMIKATKAKFPMPQAYRKPERPADR
jgi:hypothetical protein